MRETEVEIANSTGEASQQGGAESVLPIDLESITPEQFDELKQRALKASESWERLLRTTADFDNFRKRATREKQEAIRYANESLLEKLLPVLEGFDMAMAAAQSTAPESGQSFQTGVKMVHQQLKTVLADAGLEEVDAMGQPFDPNLHEAISQQQTNDVPEGQVVQQLRKGYKLRDRLLRPATVVIASRPS